VLLCGKCLVASTEVLRKLPAYARLPHGYGCVAIPDVNDVDALSERLDRHCPRSENPRRRSARADEPSLRPFNRASRFQKRSSTFARRR